MKNTRKTVIIWKIGNCVALSLLQGSSNLHSVLSVHSYVTSRVTTDAASQHFFRRHVANEKQGLDHVALGNQSTDKQVLIDKRISDKRRKSFNSRHFACLKSRRNSDDFLLSYCLMYIIRVCFCKISVR